MGTGIALYRLDPSRVKQVALLLELGALALALAVGWVAGITL